MDDARNIRCFPFILRKGKSEVTCTHHYNSDMAQQKELQYDNLACEYVQDTLQIYIYLHKKIFLSNKVLEI